MILIFSIYDRIFNLHLKLNFKNSPAVTPTHTILSTYILFWNIFLFFKFNEQLINLKSCNVFKFIQHYSITINS